jgi:hypothetical protein
VAQALAKTTKDQDEREPERKHRPDLRQKRNPRGAGPMAHKRLMDSDPKLGFAFRTVVEKVKNGELTAEDIIVKLSKRKSRA